MSEQERADQKRKHYHRVADGAANLPHNPEVDAVVDELIAKASAKQAGNRTPLEIEEIAKLRAELATANKVIDQHRSQLALAAYYLNGYTNDAEPALHAKRVIRNGLIDLDRVIGTRMVRPAKEEPAGE